MTTANNGRKAVHKNLIRGAALVVLAVLTLGCSSTWSATDKALATGYVASNIVDYGQTNYALQHGYAEGNPMLGKSPSSSRILVLKGATTAATLWLADRLPNRRRLILGVGLGLEAGVLGNNARYVGFHFGWSSGGSSASAATAASISAAVVSSRRTPRMNLGRGHAGRDGGQDGATMPPDAPGMARRLRL